MIQKAIAKDKSLSLASNLFDHWVRRRQKRPGLRTADTLKTLETVAKENFRGQLVEPRKEHLGELKELGNSITFSDQAALLVMMELPVLEVSTLLHRLGRQIAEDPKARYFSKINLDDNCGTGCGCGCAAMKELGYEDRLILHHQAKPFSIDPFNELETPIEVRDRLLVKDFLESYARLSTVISDRVNNRYFQMGREFAVGEEIGETIAA